MALVEKGNIHAFREIERNDGVMWNRSKNTCEKPKDDSGTKIGK
jgi:hypothetical protein